MADLQDALEERRVAPEMGWMSRGACRGTSEFIEWYPERSNGEVQARRAFCRSVCPVIDECLEYALANDEYGVWGGTSERERRRIKKQRRQSLRVVALSA